MNVLEALRRPRSALVSAAVALAVVGIALATSAQPTRGQSGSPYPTVDPTYTYDQLYWMSTNYYYRISGADGPPGDLSSPFNLPPTVNGWQELYVYWKSQMTSTAVNGPLASFATTSDHLFQRSGGYPFESDDAEVTIPGATCPGQRVLLGSHPDETPVPTDIVSEINSGSTSGVNGFGAARREITDSNLGNEGAYDGLSGVAVSMGEYEALLQWYAANGTYPSRTFKVALMDASRGKTANGEFSREGSQYYVNNLIPAGPQGQYVLYANMDSLGLDYPAYHLGTQYYWNNITGGGVPPWYTFIEATPVAPNNVYPNTGAGSAGANILANSTAIGQLHTDLQNAVTAGFAEQGAKYNYLVPQENPLRYNQTGQAPDPYSGVVPEVPAYSASDQAAYSPVSDDTTATEDEQAFSDAGIPSFTVSGVKNSNTQENPYAASVSATVKATPIIDYAGNQTTWQIGDSEPVAGMSTTSAATAVGATNVFVGATNVFAVGNPVFIDTGTNIEYNQITAIGTASTSTTLSAAALAGATNIKVAADSNITAGDTITINAGATNAETASVASVGTTGATGTGLTLTSGLQFAHASAAPVFDTGSGVTLATPLTLAHAAGVPFNVNEGQPVGYTDDSIDHLNYFAAGAPHGVSGEGQPTVELSRALELPAEWTSMLLAGSDYLGSTPAPTTPIAYFETTPVKPTSTLTVTFDASFSRNSSGSTSGLEYYWDFGDGTTMATTTPTITHTFSSPIYADVKLVVLQSGGVAGLYRQAVAVDGPTGSAPATNPCGTFTQAETTALVAAARAAF